MTRPPASTARWAVASFSAGVGVLALAAVPFAAALADGETLRRTALAAAIVAGAAGLLVAAALDLLGARSSRAPLRAPARRPPAHKPRNR